MNITTHYTSLKPYLFSIAYNMTGQVHEAEDLVQDAFEDVLKKNPDGVQNAKSYLTRIVMNKAIDRLQYLKKQRELYPALWLPEPYITPKENTNHDILSYVFLHLMEALNPVERAVFILRESFDYTYEDIATICNMTVDNCRQVLHRAKQKLKHVEQTKEVRSIEADEEVLQEFLKACLSNDTTRLSELLKHDVQLYSDGGGKVTAARKILEGISNVGKFLFGVVTKAVEKWSAAHVVNVNNGPALFMPEPGGVYLVLIPQFEQGKVVRIFLMRNPDKIFFSNTVTNGR